MRIEELLQFDRIVIQCHDNPDADAIASGYGVLAYLRSQGRDARLIYSGPNPIQKSNLVLMVETLHIPVEYVSELDDTPDLLLTVDCQYGEKNVRQFPAKTVAVIDHHKARPELLPALREVRDSYGACAVVVWDMLCAAGFDPGQDEELATALYYGLFMDTGKLQELRHPKDKDLRDTLEFKCNKSALFLFQNSNLSLEELRIAARALTNYDYHGEYRYAIVEAERCDPNILGIISDMLIEVDSVDACAVYCILEDGAKLSVRCCVRETRADELAAFLTKDLGSGGGHIRKAGGFLREDLLREAEARRDERPRETGSLPEETASVVTVPLGQTVRRLLNARMTLYFQTQDFIYAGSTDVPDLSGEPLYQKKRLLLGYVRAAELYPVGTRVTVRMLEGDLPLTVREDTYLMIGAEAEVYKNDEAFFRAHNDPIDTPYQFRGEYAPTVHEAVSADDLDAVAGEWKSLKDYARCCVSRDGSLVHARQLTRRTKVFVPWSDSYLLGLPGDWLICRAEDPGDIYIVKQKIFAETYALSEEQP
ncbi:MAG: DHH family phosphoesterase [Roseburia sp.]|nr:DHH family phosphoesterase [Roseburia sp.]MCM1099563.1 DHH family phosphoesterase [Ruminococcus flavefaciens]